MEKKTYYVTMNAEHMEVRDEKIPDSNLIQHEIEATEEEIESLTQLLEKTSSEDLVMSDLSIHHLNVEYLDEDNTIYQQNFDELHRMIYELGTPDTKRKLKNEI